MKKLVTLILALVLAFSFSAVGFAETAYSNIEGEIYWIGKMYEGDGWIGITDGAKLAAKEMGVKANFTYPEGGEMDVSGQIDLVENAINAKAAAICLAPNDSNALIDVAQKVKDAGIPLIMYDTALADPTYQSAFISYDFYKQGVMAAQALGNKLGATGGTVAVINATAGNEAHMNRENGFIDTIKAEYPQISIVGETQYCNNDSVTAMNMTYDLATAHPDLTAIYAANSMCVEGVAPAVEALNSDIIVVACDTSDAIVQYVKDGIILFTSSCFAPAIGYLSVVAAVKLLAGEELTDIEWNGQTFALNKETMTYDSGVYGIDASVVADESMTYIFRPLTWFDTYKGYEW
ncbi:MAG: sugar ABC transporter substrate-binding protein [Clostridia bacterium]